MLIKLPYGKDNITFDFDDKKLKAVLTPSIHEYKPDKTQKDLVLDSLLNPVGSEKLSELAEGKKNIVIIASDHTRPVPSKIIMPLMLSEIRKGNANADITILISTGCHRGTTISELVDKFGSEIAGSEKIIIHDCDSEDMRYLGALPSGGRLVVNRIAADADLLVAEGFIEPHFFAGYSGGRKSILPGVAARETVLYNHNSGFIDDKNARTGIINGNPIHEDMIFAAKAAKLRFITNVVINSDKQIIHAVSGDFDLAHRAGCDFLNERFRVNKTAADIVVTTNGGYPLDQNIYQAVKGMSTAEASVKKNGVIIMLAKSNDGHGSTSFYETLSLNKSSDELYSEILSTGKEETIIDQWQTQIFLRIIRRASVIYISDAPDDMVRNLRMTPARDLSEALLLAEDILNTKNPTVAVIPDGVSTIVNTP